LKKEGYEEYESIRNWFTKPDGERRYEKSTERTYLCDMALFCFILRTTPDDLARLTPEKALKTQQLLEQIMYENLGHRLLSIHRRISAFHTFLEANGFIVTEQMKVHQGSLAIIRAMRIKRKS
jgi:hypothetical protein